MLKNVTNYITKKGISHAAIILSSIIAFILVFILVFIILTLPGSFFQTLLGQVILNVLAGLLSSAIASLAVATYFWFSYSFKEKNFTVHTFNYSRDSSPSKIIDDIAKKIRSITDKYLVKGEKTFQSHAISDEIEVNAFIAEKLIEEDSAKILVVPYQGMCKNLGKIFNPETTNVPGWKQGRALEEKRTFTICVTYDCKLSECIPNKKDINNGIRYFPSPIHDLRHLLMFAKSKGKESCYVLLDGNDDTSDPLKIASEQLQEFLSSEKIRRIGITFDYMSRVNRSWTADCLFLAAVAPTQELVNGIRNCLKRNGKMCILVPPTWFKNWPLLQDENEVKFFFEVWFSKFPEVRMTTVLPIPFIEYINSVKSNKAHDIIEYFTDGAFQFAQKMQCDLSQLDGVEYSKILNVMKNTAEKLISADIISDKKNHNKKTHLFEAASNGETIYDWAIVNLSPIKRHGVFCLKIETLSTIAHLGGDNKLEAISTAKGKQLECGLEKNKSKVVTK